MDIEYFDRKFLTHPAINNSPLNSYDKYSIPCLSFSLCEKPHKFLEIEFSDIWD